MTAPRSLALTCAAICTAVAPAVGWQTGSARTLDRIDDALGGGTALDSGDFFGSAVAPLGDLDGDGNNDLAIGANGDDDGGNARGAVWILFLDEDQNVSSEQKVSDTAGGFGGALDDIDFFGNSLANLGDLDGDGNVDLAVGAYLDDDGGTDRGAVWILFLDSDGTVKSEQKISDTAGGFGGTLDDSDFFGRSVTRLEDIDGDGVDEIAVGAHSDDDGGPSHGAVWILFLNTDGTVKGHQKISDTAGLFTGTLDFDDRFGYSVSSLGDLDGDGTDELAVGAILDDDGGANRGAVWVLFLDTDGTVQSHQKISSTAGGFGGALADGDRFGSSVGVMGDVDGNGVVELLVGATNDSEVGPLAGAAWTVFLNSNGTANSERENSYWNGIVGGLIRDGDELGYSISGVGDLDGDGAEDYVVGARGDDQGGSNTGAAWLFYLPPDTTGSVQAHREIGDGQGGFTGVLHDVNFFGHAVAELGDLDGDGVPDLAVGANFDNDGGPRRGAVWVLFLNSDGTVKSEQKISDTAGGFSGVIGDDHRFGSALAAVNDLNGDGVVDLAVGSDDNAVWILFLDTDGTVKAEQEISATAGGFTGGPFSLSGFGRSLAAIGDLNGDGVADLAVGEPEANEAASAPGAVWILFLDTDGTVKAEQVIGFTANGFGPPLISSFDFGAAVAPLGDLDGDDVEDIAIGAGGSSEVWTVFLNTDGTVKAKQRIDSTEGGLVGLASFIGGALSGLGDIDGDGVVELAVGNHRDHNGGTRRGAVWIWFLNPDGTVHYERKISDNTGGFTGVLNDADEFGWSVASIGDLDLDGLSELAVGARTDDGGGNDRGAVWTLFLDGDKTTPGEPYCTAGTSAAGCQALLSGTGTASATATSGYSLTAVGVEGQKDGLFFFGTNGRQANPWGSGTSYQCVVPPVARGGLLPSVGTVGSCDGSFTQDLNALWCPTCPRPLKNPGAGATVQAQLWYRDPTNTSNQTTSLSNAVEFPVRL